VRSISANPHNINDHGEKLFIPDFNLASSVLKDSFFTIPKDLKNIVTCPAKNPKESLCALGIIGALVLADKPATTFYQDHVENNLDFYRLPTIPNFHFDGADSWILYGLAGNYLGSFLSNYEKGQVTSLLATKSVLYSVVLAHLIGKTITGRNRPYRPLSDGCEDIQDVKDGFTCDPHDFGNWRSPRLDSSGEGSAMPSFHVTMLFSVAKVYQEMYDNAWIPYSLLAIFFASDIKGHNHWVSDMVAGGLLGTLIGHEVVRTYREEGSKVQVIPIVGTQSVSLHLQYRF